MVNDTGNKPDAQIFLVKLCDNSNLRVSLSALLSLAHFGGNVFGGSLLKHFSLNIRKPIEPVVAQPFEANHTYKSQNSETCNVSNTTEVAQ